ncbi:MAG: hydroxyacylglutathione hydrolase [Methyloligellaceae bacterium]
MSQLEIYQFPCLGDNYGILIHDAESNLTAAIDTPEAEAITAALKTKGWTLTHILNTHHHFDHTGGNEALKKETGCQIVGPAEEASRIPGIDIQLKEGDTFTFGSHVAKILDTRGHTSGHISYWFQQDEVIFVGDTLFAMGCGRLFEGTPEMMWNSLQKIMELPSDTVIYCGHEYTLGGAEFALSIEPDNEALNDRYKKVKQLREDGLPTLPTTLDEEMATNPFLRPSSLEIQKTLNMVGKTDLEIFTEIRARKDNF